jgi:dephospho-CoA kinase
MRIYGLTGGIASGKSTVNAMLAEHGAVVIDADAIYHGLVAPRDGQPSELTRAIAERFPGVVTAEGALDRRRLGERVFTNEEERRTLERITHPAVAAEFVRRIQELEARGVPFAFYDVPLLYERRLEDGMNGVIVVWVPEHVQIERLRARDGLSEADARKRLSAQLPLEEKKRRATWVIDNSGTREATREQVRALWGELERRANR